MLVLLVFFIETCVLGQNQFTLSRCPGLVGMVLSRVAKKVFITGASFIIYFTHIS